MYDLTKRALDVSVASVLLVVSAPLQCVIALLVRLRLGSPVLFKQNRPGKNEEIFELVKFRTMKPVDERAGVYADKDRMTALGGFLRSTSLDELPSLWNVVRGDMSLVGPRPLLVDYLGQYSPEQAKRHEVRPGMTGLAQVSGRNGLSWEEKFSLDVAYVEQRSMALDLKIALRTLQVVLTRAGVSAEGEATMSPFRGSSPALCEEPGQ